MDAAIDRSSPSIPRDRRTALVAAVDVALIVALVAVGLVSHDVNPLTAPLDAAETAAPFVIGWLAVVAFAGVYDRRATTTRRGAAATTGVAWVAAANLGLILRSSPAFEGGAAWPFNLVMTGLGLVVLVAWRVGYATVLAEEG